MNLGRAGVASIAFALTVAGRAASDDFPDWVQTAVRIPTPSGAAAAPAVVLIDDTRLDIEASGIMVETGRYAVRILHLHGRENARQTTIYNGSADKVKAADAWLVREGKDAHPTGSRDWVDLAANAPGAAVDEIRSRSIDDSEWALAGDVFACEVRVRRPLVVGQLGPFGFGGRLPTASQRLTIHVPNGFAVTAQLFGTMPPLASRPDSATWSWTASDRPYRPEEPLEARGATLDGELLVDLGAPGHPRELPLRSFASWSEVAAMTDELNHAQCDSSPALAAKVRDLTADLSNPLEKIRAVGAYVQKVRYIEINKGLRYGLGWQARRASDVFASGFGDCKDKANLMAAMLNAVGITSQRVIALAGDEIGREVHPEFPSPIQFNHAILAIAIDDTVNLPAVLTAPTLGRFLFFDPTDPYTPLGDLPSYLQGTRLYVAKPGNNELITVPDFPGKDDFGIERQLEVEVTPSGAMSATGKVTATGQMASGFRHDIEGADAQQKVEKLFAAQLADSFRGAIFQERKTADDMVHNACSLSFACIHPRYSQPMPGGMTVVKLDMLSHRYLPNFSDATRNLPIELHPVFLHDRIVLKFDHAYALDELPAKVSLTTPFGVYAITYAVTDGDLVMDRTVSIARQQVAVADYARLRKFLSDIIRADRGAVLLHKKA